MQHRTLQAHEQATHRTTPCKHADHSTSPQQAFPDLQGRNAAKTTLPL